MTVSQNGWKASSSASDYVPFRWITGRIAPDPVHDLFDLWCAWFASEVEPIRKDWSWGWAYRPIRGSTRLSNHASGTAIDLNAPAHPMGSRDTFSPSQRQRIRSKLAVFGVVRWGGDYSSRPDDMHFEIWDADRDDVRRVVDRLTTLPEPTTPTAEEELMAYFSEDDIVKLKNIIDDYDAGQAGLDAALEESWAIAKKAGIVSEHTRPDGYINGERMVTFITRGMRWANPQKYGKL